MTKLNLYLQVVKAAMLGKTNQAFYDRISSIYDDVFVDHRIHAQTIVDNLSKIYLNKEHETLILDLGCGTGILAKMIARKGFKVIGMDISFDSIHLVKESAADISLIQADAKSIPVPNGCFQSVVCLGVWRHIIDPKMVLNEVSRILTENGTFIVGYFPPALAGLYFVNKSFLGRIALYLYKKIIRWLGYFDRIDFELEDQTLDALNKRFSQVRIVDSGSHWHLLNARFPIRGNSII